MEFFVLAVLAVPICAIVALVLASQARQQLKTLDDQLSSLMRESSQHKTEILGLHGKIKQLQEINTEINDLVSALTGDVIKLRGLTHDAPKIEQVPGPLQIERAPTPAGASEPQSAPTEERRDIEEFPVAAERNTEAPAQPVASAEVSASLSLSAVPGSMGASKTSLPEKRQEATASIAATSASTVEARQGPATKEAKSAEPVLFDWESLIGVKLFSWLAGIALAIAAVFLIRYSLEQSWFTPTIRVALGLMAGVALLIGGETKKAREYAITANALEGGGIAILYITIFGAAVWWSLFPLLVGLGLVVVVTALSVFLAYRHGSLFIGILGLVSGFAAPALFSTGQDNAVGLFVYLLLLDGSFWWLTYRKKWPGLLDASIVLTTIYQWGWLHKFFTIEKLPIAIGAFLVFPVLGFVAFWLLTRREAGESKRLLQSACINAVLPLLFAFFLISLAQDESVELFFYSFTGSLLVGYFVVRLLFQEERLHLVGSFSSLLLLSAWSAYSSDSSLDYVLYAALLCSLFYLAAPLIAKRIGHGATNESELALIPSPLFLFFFPALLVNGVTWLHLGLFLALGLVLSSVSALSKRSMLYLLSMVASLLAILFWQDSPQMKGWLIALMFCSAPFVVVGLIFVRAIPEKSEDGELWWNMLPERFAAFAGAGGLFLAQAIAVVVSQQLPGESPSLWLVWYLVLVLGFFWHSKVSGLGYLLSLASLSSMGAVFAWPVSGEHLGLGLPLYFAFLLFPALVSGKRASTLDSGFAAVSASALLLVFAGEYLQEKASFGLFGLFFVGEALLLALLSFYLWRREPVGQRRQPHLVLLVSAAILLITLAVPTNYSKELVGMLWSVEAVLLLVLYHRVWHHGLVAFSTLLFGLSFVSLALNPDVLLYYPRTGSFLWNWFLYCYPFVAATFFIGSVLCKKTVEAPPVTGPIQTKADDPVASLQGLFMQGWLGEPLLRASNMVGPLFGGGVLLLFVLLNIEIADLYSEGLTLEFRFLSERVSEGLAYTLGWAFFAIALLIVGIVLKQRTSRFASIGLLLLTTLKCFLLDLGNLSGLYRVSAFVGLAFALAGVALLLQRFVLRKDS